MIDTLRRGRPKGATRYAKTDQEILAKVAELVTDAEPPLTPTAAMRKLGHCEAAALRRLQRKWRMTGAELQVKVRDRRRAVASHRFPAQGSGSYSYSDIGSFAFPQSLGAIGLVQAEMDRAQRLRDMIDPPGGRMIREIMEHQRQFQDLVSSPLMRALGLRR